MEAAAQRAEMEVRAERNRQLREEEAKFEKPNPLELYLEMLAATDEAVIAKEGFTAMGSASDVPKLFRCNGKVGAPFPSRWERSWYQHLSAEDESAFCDENICWSRTN